MSVWAKFKNYVFGTPLPAEPQPAVVEQKQPEVVPPVIEQKQPEPKHIDLTISDVKVEATVTVDPPPSVEIKPAEPVKKKAPAKKRTTKKKVN